MRLYHIALLIAGFILFQFCKNSNATSEKQAVINNPTPSGKSGKELSEIYCGSCHQYPTPDLLDKTNWTKGLLPNMGARLGIKTTNYNPLKGLGIEDQIMIDAENIYPKTPMLAQEDWDKIVAFYQNEAPEKLADNKPVAVSYLKNFVVKKPNINLQPFLTLVQITDNQIYLGSLDGKLLMLDKQLKQVDSLQFNAPPVAFFKEKDNSLNVLTIGKIYPNEQQTGAFFNIADKHAVEQFGNLRRPVHFTEADLTGDGVNEIIVCEYGYQKGQLTWYEKKNNQWYTHILATSAGASKVVAQDFNKDGLMDLAVLMAQSNEHISIFYNKGMGNFEEKQVVHFPPIYGSCDMQIVDFDGNGTLDILYTNGDNADFSMVLKPYHGIRVYLNDGKDNFTEGVFYPLHGAFQAVAADFDMDGDMDIAAVSYFPDDIKRPASNFVYLEQTQSRVFKTQTIKEAVQGKWMTLSVGDYDNDGDKDILIGSFMLSMTHSSQVEKREKIVPFLLLENTHRAANR